MAEIVLNGCTPQPLANYLKGIGVLRLVARRDPQATAAWQGENLVLRTQFSREELERYFLEHYRPTPILAPWNGGSGFYEKDNKAAIQAISTSTTPRFADYLACLEVAETVLTGFDRSSSPKGEAKAELLIRMRAALPDYALEWLDSAVLLTGNALKFPPLLGTGGNDGRLDFTNNFMQRLLDVMDAENGAPTPQSATWLGMALFGEPAPGLIKKAIGQFAPGQVGGPNAASGFEGGGGMNPWDFVLMIEGALMFAAAAVRRNAQEEEGVLSYPFTVRPTAAGSGNLGVGDASSSRGELWLPLWSQYSSYAEVRSLLAEGRVALGRRPARDALDFVRAIHRLGGYRGVDRFQRFGLLMRSGKAFLATPLERIQVTPNPHGELIDELDQRDWLSRFRRFAQGDTVSNHFVSLRKRLEDALFDLAGQAPSPAKMQALLALLGEIQSALSVSTKGRESVGPVPRLSERWAEEANDRTPAYRIARALASLRGEEGKPLPLHAQMFPVHPRFDAWIETACTAKGAAQDPACRMRLHGPTGGSLVDTLVAMLERRLWLADQFGFRDKPLHSVAGVGLDDLDVFLRDPRVDRPIATLLPGLSRCAIPKAQEQQAGEGPVLASYALLKLLLTPEAWLHDLANLPHDQRLPVPAGLVAMLASNTPAQMQRAVTSAWRRLHASKLTPIMPLASAPAMPALPGRRVAASLLIPLTYGATGRLVRSVLAQMKTPEDAAYSMD